MGGILLEYMTYCLNPDCPVHRRQNQPRSKYCITCGSKLLLKDLYRAIEPLGKGGFGRTFKAVNHGKFNEPCLIKQLSLPRKLYQKSGDLSRYIQLFEQEARRLYELRHPQIPELISYFQEGGHLYLVQEFIDGKDLKDELESKEDFNEEQIRGFLLDLLPVLDFIHKQNIIHRDIKPENIIRRKNDGKLILIDFGVSKQILDPSLTQTGTKLGTPGYAPLEQRHGKACPASDLYSLGITCIRLLTGVQPYVDSYGHIHDDLYDPLEGRWLWREALPSRKKVSRELGQILDKLIEEYVKNRYKSASEPLKDLTKQSQVLKFPVPPVPPNLISFPKLAQVPRKVAIISVALESEKGIDYASLERLLADKNWKKADEETGSKMLQVMERTKRGYLTEEDIRDFPDRDLRTIDRLWMTYSHQRFGFSIQKYLWLKCGGKPDIYDANAWQRFGDRVGWRINREWIYYSDLIFASAAPPGHLPGGVVFGWEGEILCGVLGLGGLWFLLSRKDL